ncbi:MAG: FecR family protein [Opitutaceae bacterium]
MTPKVIVFPDGSRAELNEGSEVTAHFTASERRVRLVRGEAHFSVTKDGARPFVAEAAGVAVRALGTAFNVRLDPAAVEVLVTEGRVAVAAEERAKIAEKEGPKSQRRESPPLLPDLRAGQRAVVGLTPEAPAPHIDTMSSAAIARALAWQGLRLQFNDSSLDRVAAEFNRHTRIRLIVDESAAGTLVAGTFGRITWRYLCVFWRKASASRRSVGATERSSCAKRNSDLGPGWRGSSLIRRLVGMRSS